jgi:hypothetical protein
MSLSHILQRNIGRGRPYLGASKYCPVHFTQLCMYPLSVIKI